MGPVETIRPWGSFQVLAQGERWKLKRLEILPGKRTSLQTHQNRDEYWTLLEGEAIITLRDWVGAAKAGEHFMVPRRAPHRIQAIGQIPVVLAEVQVGDCQEDDIVRLHDDHGRETR